MNTGKILFGLLIIMCTMSGYADNDTLPEKKVTVSGLVAMEAGQFVHGSYFKPFGVLYNKRWLARGQSNITLRIDIHPRLHVVAGLEAECWAPFYRKYIYSGLNQVNFNAYFTEAKGVFNWVPRDHLLELGIGKFDMKYNPDSRDLGEYMFRSTPYPQTLWTEFDFSMVRLWGFYFNHTYKSFRQQLLFTTAADHFPIFDWTPSYLASFNIFRVAELGGGISFHRFISVDNSLTRPTIHDEYRDNVPALDRKYYIDGNGDSLMVPLCGVILMARLSLDPKRLFFREEGTGIFGSEDLKLYSELSILGVKDYPMTDTMVQPAYAYDNLGDRIPIMFGINIPTFRLLDVLSVELEHWANPYPNSLEDVIRSNQACPGLINGNGANYRPENYTNSWKWAFYLKKTIFNNFQIISLFANDHYFTRNPVDALNSIQDFEEAFREKDDWYWMLKFRFLF